MRGRLKDGADMPGRPGPGFILLHQYCTTLTIFMKYLRRKADGMLCRFYCYISLPRQDTDNHRCCAISIPNFLFVVDEKGPSLARKLYVDPLFFVAGEEEIGSVGFVGTLQTQIHHRGGGYRGFNAIR